MGSQLADRLRRLESQPASIPRRSMTGEQLAGIIKRFAARARTAADRAELVRLRGMLSDGPDPDLIIPALDAAITAIDADPHPRQKEQ